MKLSIALAALIAILGIVLAVHALWPRGNSNIHGLNPAGSSPSAQGPPSSLPAHGASASGPIARPVHKPKANAAAPSPSMFRWRFKTGDAVKSTPAVFEGKVLVGSGDGCIYAIDLATGAEVWRFKTAGAVDAEPLAADGRVYIGSADGYMYCLDANTGAMKWKFQTGDKIVGGAKLVASPQGGPWIVFGSYDDNLYCLDADGQQVWVYKTSYYINGSPAAGGGLVVFGGCDKLLHVVRAETGGRVFTVDVKGNVAASVGLAGNQAFVGNYQGEFFCVDVEEGQVSWSRSFEGPILSSAAADDRRVIFGAADGRLYCLDRADGNTVWSFAAGDAVNGSPIISGGRVIVGADDGRLYAVSPADGSKLASWLIGQPISGAAAVAGDTIIVGCDDGWVYAIDMKK